MFSGGSKGNIRKEEANKENSDKKWVNNPKRVFGHTF